MMEMSPAQIEERVRSLGRWFHNIDLRGVKTAPDHFLGDYPAIKWRHFAHAIPADLSGKGLLFAIGIVGAGLLAIPVLTTGAAYALADTFGWRSGLHEHPRRAPQFYAVIAASTLIAMGLNFYGANPIKALFTASINMGFIAVPLLIAIMRVTGDATIMGDRVNGHPLAILSWMTTACVCAAAVALVVSWVRG
jgi:Mn2+/Fe2+ NRAMP family transporter